MKVSIIITVYNSESYLRRCLNSLINQTYKNIDVIVINDGSTDQSEKIINEYVKKDNRVRIINQKNQGCAVARLNGIKIAKGKYCMFVDSDDWIEENTIEELVKKIELTNAEIIKFRFICEPSKKIQESYMDYKETLFNSEEKKKIYYILMTTTKLNNLANQIVKTDLFDVNDINLKENINQGEDLLINLNLFYKAKKILLVDDIYYHYFRNDKSITNNIELNKIIKNIKDLLYVYRIKEQYKKKMGMCNNQKIANLIGLHNLNGIYGQIFKMLQCKHLKKQDLNNVQKILSEKNFYNLIKDVEKNDIKDKNLLKRIMKLNIFDKRIERNYKYRYLISLYIRIKMEKKHARID